ncbi:MAG: hypothetical protein Q8M29_11485 [Bacteroidota bacterium]|nr:hypothetical protein [Bacteroidota bacterium]
MKRSITLADNNNTILNPMILNKFIKKIAALLLLPCCGAVAYAQQFNYSISLDTTFNYTDLSSATVLSQNAKWLVKYEIPTGFDTIGNTLQKVNLETNGFVIYNKNLNHALMAFKGFNCKLDSNSNFSQLSYLTTGTAGSKILKIEFKNVGQGEDPKELLSYQLWLKENGVFEIAVGPNSYQKNPGDTIIDTMQVVHIGLINRNMDTESNGLFISGTPQNPVSSPLNSQNTELAFLRTVPKRGYKYTFTPIQN